MMTTKLVSGTKDLAFHKNWLRVTYLKKFRMDVVAKPVPLSSIFEIRYINLISKINKFNLISNVGDDAEFYIDDWVNATATAVVKELEELHLLEHQVAIHASSNYDNGIQIELDSGYIKADIEILKNGVIELTNYNGENGTATSHTFLAGEIDLIGEYLNLNEHAYA